MLFFRMKCVAYFYTLVFFSYGLFASEQLTIISPHRKSIQQELIPLFKKHYKSQYKKDISVRWLDQGGTENNLRYVMGKYQKTPKSSQIDVFWGGGDLTFLELEKLQLLEKISLDPKRKKELPESVAGLALKSRDDYWFASAASSFGIFYNKKLIQWLKLKEPKSWEDLAHPQFYDSISFADVRHSSSSLVLLTIILLGHSWQKAWEILIKIAANTREFTLSSAEPIKKVVTGDVVAAGSIDFYAYSKIARLGHQSLAFVLPERLTLLNSDPVAILKGAPHKKEAERFIDFILSPQAQKVLILPKGSEGGPKFHTLARMAINPLAYEQTQGLASSSINPFLLKTPSFHFDMEQIRDSKRIISDLLSTILIDLHPKLKKAWQSILNRKDKSAEQTLFAPPFAKKLLWTYAASWKDESFRQKKINEWTQRFKARYEKLLSRKES